MAKPCKVFQNDNHVFRVSKRKILEGISPFIIISFTINMYVWARYYDTVRILMRRSTNINSCKNMYFSRAVIVFVFFQIDTAAPNIKNEFFFAIKRNKIM